MFVFGMSFSDDDFFVLFLVSFVYFVFVMGLGIIFWIFNKMFFFEVFKEYIVDFFVIMEMCVYFFENNFIFKYYGFFWLFIVVFVECFIVNRIYFGVFENFVKVFY